MKILRKILLVLLSLSVINANAAQDDDTNAIVKTVVENFMKQNNIPGVAVEMYVDGQPHSYYFGFANVERKVPVTKNTIFELGSISKIMTSILFAQQLDAAKLDLNAPVKKFLPQLSAAFNDVTLQDLATHTSGLPFNIPSTITNRTELNSYLSNWNTNLNAGEKWVYSNLGIGLLGYSLEASTHKDLNDLLRSNLLNPLKMQPIGLSLTSKYRPYLAQGYNQDGQPVAEQTTSRELLQSAWAAKASANDLQHFLSAAIGLPGTPARILYPIRMTQAAYVNLGDKQQGLGWQIHNLLPENIDGLLNEPTDMNMGPITAELLEKPVYNGNALIDKTGATSGFRSYIAVIPNKKSGIVILTNRYVSNAAIVDVGREILLKSTHYIQPEA